MVEPHQIFGRLGNQLFQMAFILNFAIKNKTNVFLQDENFFKDSKKEIIALFSEGIGHIDKVSIHVRRGDYVVPPHDAFYTNLCNTDYYEKAIALFPSEKFLVFSDDIPFCKTYFKGEQFEFSEGRSEIEDLNLMASCKRGNIIANSSFSWWGAYLSGNPGNKIIAPKNWSIREVTKLPKEWTVV